MIIILAALDSNGNSSNDNGNFYSNCELDRFEWLFDSVKEQSNLIFVDKVSNAVIVSQYLKNKGYKSNYIVGSDELMQEQ
jgi:ABC-type maltose transport system permease subunit